MDRMYKGVLTNNPHPTELEIQSSYLVVSAGSVYKALLRLVHQLEDMDDVHNYTYISVYHWNSVAKKWLFDETRRIDSI